MSDVQTWSTTAVTNSEASPNGFPEGMQPSGVNDSAREVMAAIAKYRSDTDGVNTTTGSANAYVLAASRTMTAYAQGDLFTFKANFTNTGATTLNVDSLGAKAVQSHTAALVGGEIVSGGVYTVAYDGTQFQLLTQKYIDATSALKGIVELATNAEALAGSSTSVVVTPGNLGSDQTKANTGHIVLPGNIVVNWGRIAFVGSAGPASVTWSKAFSAVYACTFGHNFGTGAVLSLSGLTTTEGEITASTSVTGTAYLIAIGAA